jgi:hypothetical protein
MMKIYCPKCNWKPKKRTRWNCLCGFEFDPFENISKCPSCNYSHEFTECLNLECGKISPHLNWYSGVENNVSRLIYEVKMVKKNH